MCYRRVVGLDVEPIYARMRLKCRGSDLLFVRSSIASTASLANQRGREGIRRTAMNLSSEVDAKASRASVNRLPVRACAFEGVARDTAAIADRPTSVVKPLCQVANAVAAAHLLTQVQRPAEASTGLYSASQFACSCQANAATAGRNETHAALDVNDQGGERATDAQSDRRSAAWINQHGRLIVGIGVWRGVRDCGWRCDGIRRQEATGRRVVVACPQVVEACR